MKLITQILILSITVTLSSVLTGCATVSDPDAGPLATTTIILTRHADRDTHANSLNAKGRERAQALVVAVADMDITAIYSPNLERNRDTASPLAEKLGIEVNLVSKTVNVDSLTSTMRTKHSGEVVLWVGNSGNLKDIYRKLGGDGTAPVSYGDLFILKIKDWGNPEVIKKRYGPE